jgi:transposase
VEVSPTTRCLEVQNACRGLAAACPLCQQHSERVHSSYVRTVADVPCGGRHVILSLRVRKFVWPTPACARKIFTERLAELVESYARKTTRLINSLQAIALTAGGETGTRLAAKVGMQTKPSTLLCHLMALPLPEAPQVRILGVDDWSWKKGRRYGTILVDLEKRKSIDLLPDRKASTFAQWLRAHPEVEIISRDRGTDYAAAARDAAPQAMQIADRFHLVRNVAEVLKLLLARCRAEIRRSVFDPYAAYVLERWQAGVHDGKQLFEEIRSQGFKGSVRVVGRFLQTLREDRQPFTELAPPSPAEQFSANAAVWLFIREYADLTDEEQKTLQFLRQASVTAETAYGLVQDFLTMVRKREGERLDAWLESAQNSHIQELQRFALGILRDKQPVLAGLTQIYSNGPVEAQVHKLKLVKRQMFGRAKLPLLKQRLLHTL